MDASNGNIYGPGEPVPEGVELTEIEKEQYDALRKVRQRDVEDAMRRIQQRQSNPGR